MESKSFRAVPLEAHIEGALVCYGRYGMALLLGQLGVECLILLFEQLHLLEDNLHSSFLLNLLCLKLYLEGIYSF